MKFTRCFALLLLLIGNFYAEGQTVSDFIRKAMDSYGSWNSLHSFYYANDRINVNKWQAYSYTDPERNHNNAEIYLDLDKSTYHQHAVFRSPGGYIFDLVFIGKDSTRFIYDNLMSRNGKVLLKQGRDIYLFAITQAKQNFPWFLLQVLSESKDSLQYSNQPNKVIIKRFLKDGTTIAYLFDAGNLYLEKMIRTAGAQKTERVFGDYRKVGGLALPFTIHQYADGNFVAADSVTSFKANLAIPDSLYEIPHIYVLQKETAPRPLSAKEISKDVFLIEGVGGDRNVVFVNMNDYIVVTEAPLSPDITKSVIELIHKTIPGKPIRYVHISHFHNDHSTGVRQFVAEGVSIITTPPMEIPLRAILNGELAVFKDDYAKDPKTPSFELFSTLKVLEDKDHRIEFREVANSHALGMSFVYLPKEKIIYEGDLLTVPEDGTITSAIPITREFNSYLKKNKIQWNRMIGHHGYSFITPAMFRQALGKTR